MVKEYSVKCCQIWCAIFVGLLCAAVLHVADLTAKQLFAYARSTILEPLQSRTQWFYLGSYHAVSIQGLSEGLAPNLQQPWPIAQQRAFQLLGQLTCQAQHCHALHGLYVIK